MGYLLFFVYLIILCWLLPRIKFIKNSGIETRWIIGLFLIRVAVAVLYNFINNYYYHDVADATSLNKLGLEEYQLLLNNPKEYFSSFFQDSHNNHFSGFFDIVDSYWNDLRTNIILKLLAITDLLSFGNLFINGLLINFPIFLSSVLLFKVFNNIYQHKKWFVIIAVFLLPSVVYFTSGFHRDGLIFIGVCVALYHFYFLMKKKDRIVMRLIAIILSLMFILLLRNFVFVMMVPAMIAWYIAEKYGKYALSIFFICYAFFLAIFFIAPQINPKLNGPKFVSDRQLAFMRPAGYASSTIYISPLFPNFRSFLNNAPQAFNHGAMRPYLSEKFSLLYVPIAIEVFLYEALFIFYLFYRRRGQKTDPFIYFGIFLSISMFLGIGYTIPIIGAIVRYRCIYLPFIVAPMLCNIDWPKWRIFVPVKSF